MVKKPERVGATIERASLKRFLARLKKKYEGMTNALAAIDEVLEYAGGRVKRFSKKEGGL